ncbi:MAG: CidA/LrgA family protein [Ancalomicrobiaceae bacterium]|nr:CidA/LrgA family protein [Ancalomicrobiaceae bacterium]
MIIGFAALLVCQLAGEITVRWLGLPLPGPVVGMMLLVVAIALRSLALRRFGGGKAEAPVSHVADSLLGNLGLLFVPAGVGVVQYLDLIAANGAAIGIAIVVSTVLALVATVVTFRVVKRLLPASDAPTSDAGDRA